MNPTTRIITTNPLVPRWRMDSTNPSETPPGFRDQFFQYAMDFTIAANIFAQSLFIILDRDADFVLRQIEADAYQTGTSAGSQLGAFRLRDSFGNPLSDDLLLLNDVFGPIFTELWMPGGSRVFLDFDNTQNGFSVQVAVTLRGCKRFKR
jgi:hypothetical protein